MNSMLSFHVELCGLCGFHINSMSPFHMESIRNLPGLSGIHVESMHHVHGMDVDCGHTRWNPGGEGGLVKLGERSYYIYIIVTV